MTEVFKPFTKTIQKLLLRYDKDLAYAFTEKNIDEIWQKHDNWNGGIDFFLIKLNLPIDVYYKMKEANRISEAESKIASYYEDLLKVDESVKLNGVAITPRDDGQMDFGVNSNDMMWKPGCFRLFISHSTMNKESASNLKNNLARYGIDCFVAHEDIAPSKEWEVEIENGLFTMDALCAIVTKEFAESEWCDQEVGIALGQHKLVISIKKGLNPYGFFGKFQALKSKKYAAEMAMDVWRAISNNDHTKTVYSDKLINMLLNAKSNLVCEQLMQVIEMFENIDRRFVETLHDHYSDNSLLMATNNLAKANKIFERYELSEIGRKSGGVKDIVEVDDLPF